MSVLVATATHESRFGTSRLSVYAPARPPGQSGPVALASVSGPEISAGSLSPAFLALVRPTTLEWSVLDPTGLLAAVREAHPAEQDVYADVETPRLGTAGGPNGGLLRWRFAVTGAGPRSRQPSETRADRPVTVSGRCGLGRLDGADGPPTGGATLAGYVRALVDAAGLAGYPVRLDVPVWPAAEDGSPLATTFAEGLGRYRDPRLVRFAPIASEDDPAAEDPFGGLEGTGAQGAADALCLALTATLSVDPRPEAWANGPGGRVPTVLLSARSRGAVGPATRGAVVYPAGWPSEVAADALAPARVALSAAEAFDADGDDGDLEPLRSVTMETDGVSEFVVVDLDEGEPFERLVGRFAPGDAFRFRLIADHDGEVVRAGLRLDAGGASLYADGAGWVAAPTFAIALTDSDPTAPLVAEVPLTGASGFVEGDVYLVAEGTSDVSGPQSLGVELREFGTGALVDSFALTVSTGFRGRRVDLPGLHRLEHYDGSAWARPPRWRSDAAASAGAPGSVGGVYSRAAYAQAYERAAQEAPPGPAPLFLHVDGVLAPTAVPDVEGVGPCHVLGATVAPVDGPEGGTTLQLATVLPGGAAPANTNDPRPQL